MLQWCGLDPDLRALRPSEGGKCLARGQAAPALRDASLAVDPRRAAGQQKLQTFSVFHRDAGIGPPILDPDALGPVREQQPRGLRTGAQRQRSTLAGLAVDLHVITPAELPQAQRQVDLIADSRAETQLIAPFDAVVNAVEVQSFDTLQPGRVAVTIYPEIALQARILVSYDVVSQLVLGQTVNLRPADQRDRALPAVVSEIADRAPAVSAFPVIITLQEVLPALRSGMAAEVLIDMSAGDGAGGMPVPVSALAMHLTEALEPTGPDSRHRTGRLFVYQPDGRLVLRDVVLAGLDEARMIVVEGLTPGDRVVTAGVPFLQPGQEVRLMDGEAP